MDPESRKRILDEMASLDPGSGGFEVAELDPEKLKAFQGGLSGQPIVQQPAPQPRPEDTEDQKKFFKSVKHSLRG